MTNKMNRFAGFSLMVVCFFLSQMTLLPITDSVFNLSTSTILLAQQSNSNPPSRGTLDNRKSAGPRLLELPDDGFSSRHRSAEIYFPPSINEYLRSVSVGDTIGGISNTSILGIPGLFGINPNNSNQNDLNREYYVIYTQGLQP